MKTYAQWIIKHRWWVIAGWVVLLVAMQMLASAAGGANYKDEFKLPHTETDTVSSLLSQGGQSKQNDLDGTMVLHSRSGRFSATQPPQDVVQALTSVCGGTYKVSSVSSPWGGIDCRGTTGTLVPAGANPSMLSSKDPSIALVQVSFAGGGKYDQHAVNDTYDVLKKLNSDTLQVEFTGNGFQNVGESASDSTPEMLGFLAALIILSLVFRTVGTVLTPLLSAACALTLGLSVIALLTHAMNVSNVTPELAQLMVIGVGVDYALFIITRHRRNLQRGMSVHESITIAINTSGRAVLFAGATVCVAMLGLIFLGVSFFYGMAIGVAVAVSMTMLASLTLLPAILSLLGRRALPRRQREALPLDRYFPGFWIRRALGKDTQAGPKSTQQRRLWARWAEYVADHKALTGAVATLIIVLLAIPFFSMRLGHADQGNDPADTTTRKGYDLIAQGFGVGYNSTLTLVVNGPHIQQTAAQVAAELRSGAVADVDPTSVFALPKPLNPTLTIVSIKSTTSPQDKATTDLVSTLRDDVLPPIYRSTGDHVYVYGQTAVYADFSHVLATKMPLFIGGVVIISFLLLMLAFRSLVVPATAALMNLFAAGASFGLIVMIFQWGWGAEALGIGKGGPIEAFAPVLFFAILFGLSMDYQVFLVSRMHEEWVHTRDNRRAITVGQSETGGIITAAAIIMIAVFSGFVLGDNRAVKLIGLGLASAIFIDAFLLRTILVPAVMHIMGKANWYFPGWLDRITPKVSVEGESDAWDDELPEGRELTKV